MTKKRAKLPSMQGVKSINHNSTRQPSELLFLLLLLLLLLFSEKIRSGISCKLSAQKTIHMKCQALFKK